MPANFQKRFNSIWARNVRVHAARILVDVVLCVALGIGLLTLLDYRFELTRNWRLGMLLGVCGLSALLLVRWVWRLSQNWAPAVTASEIESSFPQLGQSVRTTMQYAEMSPEQVAAEGVAGTLVTALVEETHKQALPLTIEDVVPLRRFWQITAVVAVGLLIWVSAAGINWEWRLATQRALLSDEDYRNLGVETGNQTIDEGASIELVASLVGRTDRELTFETRSAGKSDADWTVRPSTSRDEPNPSPPVAAVTASALPALPAVDPARPGRVASLKLERLTRPLEYRVLAGDLSSPVYRIDIRRPLRLSGIHIDLTPPAYTGQPTSTVRDPNLAVLQGTHARFGFEFDKPVKQAQLIFSTRTPLEAEQAAAAPEVIPMVLQPQSASGEASWMVVADMQLNADQNYSIVAEASDGTVLPANKYRIRVREDQPPQVFFESPEDPIEVHSLAELPMRVRVRDDYGLKQAGIVFQINNEQQIPLVEQDFAVVAEASQEVAATGKLSPTTQAALEKILPLEYFELAQTDSVMYFAFAEDNLPGKPQRTETDLRFIDIRPLKRTYAVIDPDPMNTGMNQGIELKTLEELIQRQRFALNRTVQVERRAAAGRPPEAVALQQMIEFETELAQSVRDTANGLQARGFDDVELLHQAEASMLQATDSLSVGNWENATLQMKDALKFLIEQRDRTARFIFKNPDPARLAALRAFDRQQAQKLRRPKSDKEEARELLRRLQALVDAESEVSRELNPEAPQEKAPEAEPAAESEQPSGDKPPSDEQPPAATETVQP